MLYYDSEAARYDESRGGLPRAAAAADAVRALVPSNAGIGLDVAGGTGIVGSELRRRGLAVVVVDQSIGMLRYAASRLPGRAIQADATALPIADDSVDWVSTIWLLHLLSSASVHEVIKEIARVLRPAGRFVTTVDKDASHGRWVQPVVTDRRDDVARVATSAGLVEESATTFVGHGQGFDGRADPVYTLVAFTKPVAG